MSLSDHQMTGQCSALFLGDLNGKRPLGQIWKFWASGILLFKSPGGIQLQNLVYAVVVRFFSTNSDAWGLKRTKWNIFEFLVQKVQILKF